jgi:hypothetical protein
VNLDTPVFTPDNAFYIGAQEIIREELSQT